ncbi:MAG: metallophosphoesterase [Archaeoglobaceae archaeon]
MRFLVMGDIHGRMPGFDYNEIDAVLIAGDFTNGRDNEFVAEVLDSLPVQVFAVPGNMERKGAIDILDRRRVNVHLNPLKFQDLTIFGYGGSNPTPFDTPFEVEDDRIDEELSSFGGGDIGLFHAPPYGYFDKIDGYSVGSRAIRKWIDEHKPTLAVCAHIHEHKGVARMGDTVLVKVGMACKGEAAVVEIEEGNIVVNFTK